MSKNSQLTTLYRPTGPNELRLVAEMTFIGWPPRLPEQPIFYPVTNEEYAVQIARDWNAKDDATGFVTEFDVSTDYLAQFNCEIVGDASVHTEYWIPAQELGAFNDEILRADSCDAGVSREPAERGHSGCGARPTADQGTGFHLDQGSFEPGRTIKGPCTGRAMHRSTATTG